MSKKLVIALTLVAVAGAGFLIYVATLSNEILIREDIRIYGNQQAVHDYLCDIKNWRYLHRLRKGAKDDYSENTVGVGATWTQHLVHGDRKFTIVTANLREGIKYTVDYGGSEPLECHMAVRKHLVKGLIYVRSAKGKVSFFERLQRHDIQRLIRAETYIGNSHLEEMFPEKGGKQSKRKKNKKNG